MSKSTMEQTLDSIKLSDCPFCGASGILEEYTEENSGNLGVGTNQILMVSHKKTFYRPKCSECDCKLDNGWKNIADAAKAWNNRKSVVLFLAES